MKYKLIENEPFEISGYVNGSPITINALTDFANVIEATSTLPSVAARGTICKLTVPSTINENLTEEAVSGDSFVFPIWIAIDDTMTSINSQISNETSEHRQINLSRTNGGTPVVNIYENGQEEYAFTGVEEYDGIFKFGPLSNGGVNPNQYISTNNLVFNPGDFDIYTNYVATTRRVDVYISDGETWQQITPSITTEDPDGTVEETADLPIGESDGVKSTIYCEVRTAAGVNADEGNVLIVKGADEFLTNAYVPILLRNSNKKNGRGWHHFKSNNLFEGGNSDFCTIEDIIVINGSGQNGTYPLTAKGVKLVDDFNILSHMPAAHNNFVSHGKRKIKLVRTDSNDNTIHVNFKAKWGLAFIKATDFPANSNIRLDVAKLVTTIAPFYVYYRWQSGDNDSWTLYTVLTT